MARNDYKGGYPTWYSCIVDFEEIREMSLKAGEPLDMVDAEDDDLSFLEKIKTKNRT